jgi:UDP-N-acetyl-D-galactosamine dehydrogenase
VIDVVSELKDFGIEVDVYDPQVCGDNVRTEYRIELLPHQPDMTAYHAIILAVNHDEFRQIDFSFVREHSTVLFDVKGALPKGLVHGRL